MKKEKLGPLAWAFIGCSGLLIVFIAFVAFVLTTAFGALRTSTPYKTSVSIAQNDERVIALLGKPVRPAYLFQGSINTSNGNGDASFTIPLHGPKGGGVLEVKATKKSDAWKYDVMKVMIKDHDIDLLKMSE